MRRNMQIIFQDPYSSLDPRVPIGESIGEGLVIHGIGSKNERQKIVMDMLQEGGAGEVPRRALSARVLRRPAPAHRHRPRPGAAAQVHRLRRAGQRAGCLDPVAGAQPAASDLQKEFGLTYLFIAHNLSVVEHISDRVAVMYLGKMVELAGREELYRNPLHPYTKALMSAIPIPQPGLKRERVVLKGDVPSPLHPPSGCRFHTRCPIAGDICKQAEPVFEEKGPITGSPATRYSREQTARPPWSAETTEVLLDLGGLASPVNQLTSPNVTRDQRSVLLAHQQRSVSIHILSNARDRSSPVVTVTCPSQRVQVSAPFREDGLRRHPGHAPGSAPPSRPAAGAARARAQPAAPLSASRLVACGDDAGPARRPRR